MLHPDNVTFVNLGSSNKWIIILSRIKQASQMNNCTLHSSSLTFWIGELFDVIGSGTWSILTSNSIGLKGQKFKYTVLRFSKLGQENPLKGGNERGQYFSGNRQ